MIRRGARDQFWWVKHFFQGIFTGREYWHPEDFWWGKDDLWDWSIELGAWRWSGIFFANLSMALTGFILIPTTVHAFLLIVRPDIVVWNEFFNTNSLVGWFYLGIYAASFSLALITTFTSYRKYRGEQLRRGSS